MRPGGRLWDVVRGRSAEPATVVPQGRHHGAVNDTTTAPGRSAAPAPAAAGGARPYGAAAVGVATTLAVLTLLDTLRVQRAITSWDTYLPEPTDRPAALYLLGAGLALGGAWPLRRRAGGVLGLFAAGYLAAMTARTVLSGSSWGAWDAGTRLLLPGLPLLGLVVGIGLAVGRDGEARAGSGARTTETVGGAADDDGRDVVAGHLPAVVVDRRRGLHLVAMLLAPVAGAAAFPATTDLQRWIWGPELSATTFLLPLALVLVPAAALATSAGRAALRGDVRGAVRHGALLATLVAAAAAGCLVVAKDRNGILYPHGEPWRVPTAVALAAAVVLGACAGRVVGARRRVVPLAVVGAATVPAVLGPVVPLLWHPTPSGTVAGLLVVATVAAATAVAAVAARRPASSAVSRPATPGGP